MLFRAEFIEPGIKKLYKGQYSAANFYGLL